MSPRAEALPQTERRDQIVDAALPLLREHGRQVTTRQIADAAGIAEGTIFRAFASKEEIIEAALARLADASVLGQRRLAALGRTLAQLEQTPPRPVGADFGLDQITVAVGLEYVRFRLPALLPADAYPRLHAWLAAARPRPSLHATRFE